MSGDASDLPVSVRMVVSGPGPPEPELEETLGLPDFSADIDPVPGESFPRSGSILARPVFLDACVPGLGRSLPESGGLPDGPGSADDFGSGSGKPLPRYGGALSEWDFLDAIEDEHEAFFWESGARLSPLGITSGMDMGDGVHWPGSDVLDIVNNFGLASDRSFPGSGGIIKLADVLGKMETGPRNVLPEADAVFIWPEFGDMAPGTTCMTGMWLPTLTLASSGSRQFSASAAGDVPLSDESGICCLHTSTL